MSGSDSNGREGSQEGQRRGRGPEWTAPTRQTIPGSATPDQWRQHLRVISRRRIGQIRETESQTQDISRSSSVRSVTEGFPVSSVSSYRSVSPTQSVSSGGYTPPPTSLSPTHSLTSAHRISPTPRPDSPFAPTLQSSGRGGYVPALPPMPDLDRYGYGNDSDADDGNDFVPIQPAAPHRQLVPIQHIQAYRPRPEPDVAEFDVGTGEVRINMPSAAPHWPLRRSQSMSAIGRRSGGFELTDQRDPPLAQYTPLQDFDPPQCTLCGDEPSIRYNVCRCRHASANICMTCLRRSIVTRVPSLDQRHDLCYTCHSPYEGIEYVIGPNPRWTTFGRFLINNIQGDSIVLYGPLLLAAMMATYVGYNNPGAFHLFGPIVIGLMTAFYASFLAIYYREYRNRNLDRETIVDIRIDRDSALLRSPEDYF